MSLDFYYGDIKDWENICFHPDPDGQMKTVTNALIWSTMAVGINRITADNWRKYFERLHSYEVAVKPYRKRRDENNNRTGVFFTPDEVRAHIGLSTNASTRTARQFADLLASELAEKARAHLEAFDTAEGRADQ